MPVILVSELGDVSGEVLLQSGKAQDQIMRPVSQADMFETIERVATASLRGADALAASNEISDSLPDFAGAWVLVADDNAINREVVSEALRRFNVSVDTAVDGQAALRKWQDGKYSLIFMDCSMPVMDGYAATRLIREGEISNQDKPTPVIALTAHVAGGQADQWQQAGMDDIITKPFTLDTIAKCLATWLPVTFDEAPAAASNTGPSISQPTGRGGKPVIDNDAIVSIREMSGGNDDLLHKTTELFKEHAPKALTRLTDPADAKDLKALADAAHALKSMCANMGAARAASLCNQFEKRSLTGARVDVASYAAAISLELAAAISELNAICQARSD